MAPPGIGGGPTPSGGIPEPLDLTIQGDDVSRDVKALGDVGTSLAEDGLSVMEQQFLESSALAMLSDPNLPEPDRAALQAWLQTVSSAPTTENIPVATDITPEVAKELASTNAEVVENALFTMTGSKLTPEQKQALKDGGVFRQLAIIIAQRNAEPGTAKPLQSMIPQQIAQELNALLEELDISDDPELQDAFAALQGSVEDIAQDLQVANVLVAFMPEENPMSSTDQSVVYNGLLEQVDTSGMTEDEVAQVQAALQEIAEQIAQANESGQPIAGLDSDNPEDVKAALLALLGGEAPDDASPVGRALASLANSIANSIAAASGSGKPLGGMPQGDPLASTDQSVVLHGLLGQADTSDMTEGEVAQVQAALQEIAEQIAQANESGQPIAGLDSDNPENVKAALVALLGGEAPGDASPIGRALTSIANSVAAPGGGGGPPPPGDVLLTAPRGFNAYMTPGIMAYLAPILSELAEIYAQIIQQSSELKQNMMGLMVAMAMDAYTWAIAAGEAKVKLLELEVQQAIMGVATAVASIAIAGVTTGIMVGRGAMQQRNWVSNTNGPTKNPITGHDLKTPLPGKGVPDTSKPPIGKNPDGSPKFPSRFANESDYLKSPEFQRNQTTNQSLNALFGSVNSGFSSGLQNLGTAIFKSQMINPTMEQAEAEAMSQFINQLIQIVVDTMKTAAEEISRADKDWQSFNQLFRDMAATIRQAIYSQA